MEGIWSRHLRHQPDTVTVLDSANTIDSLPPSTAFSPQLISLVINPSPLKCLLGYCFFLARSATSCTNLRYSEEHALEAVVDSNGQGWLCLDSFDQAENLVPRSTDGDKFKTGDGNVVANQLQYVCHQLRLETKTLSIQYNTISFRGKDPTAAEAFMNGLSPRFHESIRQLILRTSETNWMLKLSTGIIQFCEKHPNPSLRFHDPNLTSAQANSLLFTTFLIKHHLRGETTFVRKLSDCIIIQQKLLAMLWERVQEDNLASMPSNVIFFPHDERLDEAVFHASCAANSIINKILVPTLKNGMDDLIAIAKDCYENGF
ncbi:hypothetical protein BKA63DRAFT_562175 [Paraphoma chrysanthemicola]|nr:hypothetical protein BKA63DRAFT_562175 [Paraphoma chrysanthemicola]